MAGNIKVDLILNDAKAKGQIRDVEIALQKLGYKSVQDAFNKNPGLSRAIASGVGIPIEQAMRQGVERGIKQAYSGKPPPVIPTFFSGLQGRLASYIAGRSLANVAMGNFGGGIAGGLGGLAASGPWGAAASAAASAAIGLANALKTATELLKNWAEAGAKLFQRAARVGLSSGQTFLAQSYAQILGVSPEQVENLLLRGQFGGRGGRGIAGSIPGLGYLAGRGPQGSGDIQQITNMAQSLASYAASIRVTLAQDVVLVQRAAGYSERVSIGFERVSQEIEVFKMTVVEGFAPALNLLTATLADFTHAMSVIIDRIRNNAAIQAAILGLASGLGLGNLMALFGNNNLSQHNFRVTPFQRGGASALEKMGLVIGGGHDRVLSVLQKIEQNTRITAGHLQYQWSNGQSSFDPLNLLGPPQHNTP